MISTIAFTLAISLLSPSIDGDSRAEKEIVCRTRGLAEGDRVSALTCQGLGGFFVPSDFWRRPDGVEASYLVRPIHEAQLDARASTIASLAAALHTATVALGLSDRAIVKGVSTIDKLSNRIETLTDDLAERDGSLAWKTLATCGGCGVLAALSCVGVANALPR